MLSELQDISQLHPDYVSKILTNKTFLPITPQKQGAIIDLLHNGLHRSLKTLNFFERFRLPHEVESVDDQVPKSTYFLIAVLLCFQNLQVHNRTSFSQGVNRWYTPFAQQREHSMRVSRRDGPEFVSVPCRE